MSPGHGGIITKKADDNLQQDDGGHGEIVWKVQAEADVREGAVDEEIVKNIDEKRFLADFFHERSQIFRNDFSKFF